MSVEKQTIKYKKENVLKKNKNDPYEISTYNSFTNNYILYYLYIHFSKNLFLQTNSTIHSN